MRRRPLLRAAALGGAGYLAGKSAAQKAQQMQASEAQVQNLQAAQAAPPPPGVAPGPAPTADRLAQLKQLGELRQAGVLTEEEFQQEKQRILGGR